MTGSVAGDVPSAKPPATAPREGASRRAIPAAYSPVPRSHPTSISRTRGSPQFGLGHSSHSAPFLGVCFNELGELSGRTRKRFPPTSASVSTLDAGVFFAPRSEAEMKGKLNSQKMRQAQSRGRGAGAAGRPPEGRTESHHAFHRARCQSTEELHRSGKPDHEE